MVVADDVAPHRKLLSVLVEAVITALWCSMICQAMVMYLWLLRNCESQN